MKPESRENILQEIAEAKQQIAHDALAFTETCRRIDIPYAIERSRSGNGAHVWFFFSNPVSAATARKMGS